MKIHHGMKFRKQKSLNTNPRAENGCVTIGKEIFEFYKEYFDKIVSFE